MRKITVIGSPLAKPLVLDSEATTWGSLKDVIGSNVSDINGMRATVKETRQDLFSPNAVLPEGDFVLYLSQVKMKAGAGECDVVGILEAFKSAQIEALDNVIAQAKGGTLGTSAAEVTVTEEDKAILAELSAEGRRY